MSKTVEITIVGVAIGYRKNDNWQVIFPTDNCHNIKFTHQEDNQAVINEGALASNAPILIQIMGEAGSVTGVDPAFTNNIYNLTSANTHKKVRLRDQPEDIVLMTVPNAHFSTNNGVLNFSIPDLVEVESGNTSPMPALAHSAKGTIILNEGADLIVTVNGVQKFRTANGSNYKLRFNNDCESIPDGKNDMDMYYQAIVDLDSSDNPTDKRFRIGGTGLPMTVSKNLRTLLDKFKVLKDPPDLPSMLVGNTCLFAQVSETDSIDGLPG